MKEFDWKEIQKFYDDNHTWNDIKEKFKVSNYHISYAIKNGFLKLRSRSDSYKLMYKLHRRIIPTNCKYNWKEIQKFYDDNHTWNDIKEKFGCSNGAIHKALKRGRLKTRGRSKSLKLYYEKHGGFKWTDKMKESHSHIMREYFQKNPNKVGYRLNHSSKKSYPEKIFENALILFNITGWKYGYNCGIYRYDFAFVNKKIDVEVDGKTHDQENVKKIDDRRDKWSKLNGWKVIRFTAKEIKNDVVECVNKLKVLLSE